MRSILQHKGQSAAAAAVVVGLVAIAFALVTLLTLDDSADGTTDSSVGADRLAPPLTTDTLAPRVSATGGPSNPLIGPGGTLAPDQIPPGLLGSGRSTPAEKHAVTLRVTSPGPIDFVNYYVPAAVPASNRSGLDTNVGTSWSKSVSAIGRPKYAVLFLQADGAGTPITCSVTVDGKVTDKRTTEGPYGQIVCQG